jgi:uncharacterized protein
MNILKVPLMKKKEYDEVISEGYISRIAFQGEYPYIAPFLYVFDGNYLYFLSTKYGKKIEMFRENPLVAVEIEQYSSDLSEDNFVTLQGRIGEIKDLKKKRNIKEMFVNMIKNKGLSENIMAALGHSTLSPLESIVEADKSFVWKLRDVHKIVGIKTPEDD